MENEYKFVYFDVYCQTCKHCDEPETEFVCSDCLAEPANINSHKPVNWEEK